MILVKNNRNKGGENMPARPQELTPFNAMCRAILYEMGFGGRVVVQETERIVIQTHVLADIDTTVFEGSADEMQILHRALDLYAGYQGNNDNIGRLTESMSSRQAGAAEFMLVGLGMMVGNNTAKSVVQIMAGATPKFVEFSRYLGDREFEEAMELCNDNVPEKDIVEMCVVLPKANAENVAELRNYFRSLSI